MRRLTYLLGLITASLSLAGCAGQFATDRAAVDYNRALANARNEILLLNVLRAWAYEPLQFSTVSQVSGSVQASTQLSLPLANVLAGGDPAEFGPGLSITNRNPNVTILPLDTREFVQGVNRPVGAQVIDHLITQGWSRPTVLSLAIGGVQCGARDRDDVRMNYGPESEHADRFVRVFQDADRFNVESRAVARVSLPADEAVELVRQGTASGLRARLAAPPGHGHDEVQALGISGAPPGGGQPLPAQQTLDVELIDDNSAVLSGLDFARFCDPHAGPDAAGEWRLIMRSVQGMIRYLAEVHRANVAHDAADCRRPAMPPAGPVAFHIYATCPGEGPPADAAISTYFRGQHFYVPHATATNDGGETLRIFSMLSELLALQVTEQSVASSRPVIAVSQ